MKKTKQTELKFKKLNYTIKDEQGNEKEMESAGKLPTRSTEYSAGLDLYPTRMTQEVDNSGKVVLVYHTDIAVEIPEGYVGLIAMKSSVSKRSITLANAVGVLDSDYRGEIMLKYKITTDAVPTVYSLEEPIGQLLVVPALIQTPVLVDELSETTRGAKGFGEATAAAAEKK